MRESIIQRRIREYLEGRGAYVHKYQSGMYTGSGKSDLWVCYRGMFVVFEVKKPYAVTAKSRAVEQQAHLQAVRNAGGLAGQVDSLDQAKKYIFNLDATLDGLSWR